MTSLKPWKKMNYRHECVEGRAHAVFVTVISHVNKRPITGIGYIIKVALQQLIK